MFIATYVADGALRADDMRRACKLLVDIGCEVREPVWLEEGTACDIFYQPPRAGADFSSDHGVDIGHYRLGGYFEGYDLVIQPAMDREKRLLVADMDSTMITVECVDELADYAGLKPEIAAITEAAMRGELDFEAALDARVALLAGLDADVIDRCLAERVTIMPGAKALVRTMRARGGRAVLVSGGFTRFAEPVARAIGFDHAIANELLIEDGRLTGAVRKPIVGAQTKLATLRAEAAALGIELAATLAVGDGANDLPMVQAAGLGVAYHAKPIVAAAAGARVNFGDLTALLWAQGIPRREWVEG